MSCGDEYAARGMRLLGRPEPGDPAIVSGESGAVGVGVVAAILCEDGLEDLRWTLGLHERSRVAVHQHRGGHRPGELPEDPGGVSGPPPERVCSHIRGGRWVPYV